MGQMVPNALLLYQQRVSYDVKPQWASLRMSVFDVLGQTGPWNAKMSEGSYHFP
jgi:hypothetical protein